jgi:chorismate mutase
MPPKSLSLLRKQIETIDKKIIALLIARFRTTHKIQNLKREFGIKIHQENRERILLKKYLTSNAKYLPPEFLKKLFSLIFSYAKKTGIIKRS